MVESITNITKKATAPTADSTVDVQVTVKSAVEITLPSGVTKERMKAALQETLCSTSSGGQIPGCLVIASSRRRGRSLTTETFTVSQTVDPTSTETLAPPTVDKAAVAADLNKDPGVTVDANTIPEPAVNIMDVEATVTVVSQGEASGTAASTQQSTQNELPQQLAQTLEVAASEVTTTQAATIIGPPMPPPSVPPAPPSPPVPIAPPSPTPSPPVPAPPSPTTPSASSPPVASPKAPSSPSPSSPETLEPDNSGMIIGVAAGAGAGGLLLIVVIACVICKCMKKGKSEAQLAGSIVELNYPEQAVKSQGAGVGAGAHAVTTTHV